MAIVRTGHAAIAAGVKAGTAVPPGTVILGIPSLLPWSPKKANPMLTKRLPRQATLGISPVALPAIVPAKIASAHAKRSEIGTAPETADVEIETVIVIVIVVTEIAVRKETVVETESETVAMVEIGSGSGTGIGIGIGIGVGTGVKEIERGLAGTDPNPQMHETTLHVHKPAGSNVMPAMIRTETTVGQKPQLPNPSPKKTHTHSNARHAIASECCVSNKVVEEPNLLIQSQVTAMTVDRNAWWVVVASTTSTRTSFRSVIC